MAEEKIITAKEAPEYFKEFNKVLSDDDMADAVGGTGADRGVAYNVGDKVYWKSDPEMKGEIIKVYLNEKNPLYSTYDVRFPGIVFTDMKHGWLVKIN